jgi:acetolactate synthase-1/2/3 large subunit
MTTCAEALARALRDAGVVRMFGLPGGEILAFIEAARQVGIEFVLTRDESTASFMADVTGQMERRPGVCVSTLGPGAVNLTLGVANAFLDRSPLVAVTASLARSALPYATHQNLDLNAVYRPFTKMTLTLDGLDTRAKVRRALRASLEPRMGPVHLALPSDVARAEEKVTGDVEDVDLEVPSPPPARREDIERTMDEIRRARRPVVIFGLDLDPRANRESTRRFAERLGVPVFVTPKAKGIFPEDHSLFHGVCAGVAADDVVVELFSQADLLIGLGFEPVESDKLWHHSLRLVNIGPLSIASGGFRPACELVGEVNHALRALGSAPLGPFEWSEGALAAYRRRLEDTLRPRKPPGPGVSPY